MQARRGDRLVLDGTRVGGLRRMGLIIDLSHEDGTPPYYVHWLDDGRETLAFPGPTRGPGHRPR